MKKEWFIKILALGFVLILVSLTIVVGYNSVKSTSTTDSPLFSTRIQKAINKDDSNIQTFEYLGKESENTIPVIESTSKKSDSEISLITLNVVGVNGGDNWYGSDNTFFSFTYESNEIAYICYGIDGNWLIYKEPFNVDKGGNHTLEWFAVNYDGKPSDKDGPFYFKVDKTEPELILTYEVVGGNNWIGWDLLFTATAYDSMIGMHRVEFYINNVLQETIYGPGPTYTWNLLGYHPGLKMYFYAIAYDKAGNSVKGEIEEPSYNIAKPKSFLNMENNYKKNGFQNLFNNIISSENVEIKNNEIFDKPFSSNTVGEDFDPAYVIVVFNREFGENNWINNNPSISIYYESDRINEVFYQLNNGSWILYTSPIVISEDGTYTFSWYAVDSEGHTSTIESFSFKVDKTPPQINLIKNKLTVNKVKFIAEVNDSTSGIDRVKFQSHGFVFNDYDYPYEWIWTGFLNDKVTATVYDKAGNKNSMSMKTWNSHSYIQPGNQQFLDSLFIHILKKLLNIK